MALRRSFGRHKCRPYVWRRHSAALRRPAGGDGRRGAIYDARCRNGTTRPRRCSRRCARCFRSIAVLRRLSGRHKCRPYVGRRYPAALRRSFGRHKCRPYILAAVSCGIASVVWAVIDVGAPFMTPGAGTARPVRGIARGGVRGVSGQLRRCGGFPGDTSVAPTFWDVRPRYCGGRTGRTCGLDVPLRRPAGGDGRRGAIYDARCRNGTTRPRRCSR